MIYAHQSLDLAILEVALNDNPCTRPIYPTHEQFNSNQGLIVCGLSPIRSEGKVRSIVKRFIQQYEVEVVDRKYGVTEVQISFECDAMEPGNSEERVICHGAVLSAL